MRERPINQQGDRWTDTDTDTDTHRAKREGAHRLKITSLFQSFAPLLVDGEAHSQDPNVRQAYVHDCFSIDYTLPPSF